MNSVDSFKELAYEDALAELEDIVARLESGKASLEESVVLFERGRKLSEYCQALLDNAELRINQLTDDGDVIAL